MKQKNLPVVLALMLLIAGLTACSDATATVAPTTTVATTTVAATVTPVAVTTTGGGSFVPAGKTPANTGGNGLDDQLKNMIFADIQKNGGSGPGDLEVMSFVEKDWPDTSLGCPQPGMMYQQVITPGLQVIVLDKAKNIQYDYRTAGRGGIVLCKKTP